MNIDLQWNIEPCIDDLDRFLDSVAAACYQVEGITGAVFSVTIVDADEIRRLNREMRNNDSVTDVLSFPSVSYPAGTTARDNPKRLKREYDPSFGAVNLGDCVINLDRARAQAEEFGHSLRRELGYLTAHSAFHLMGYDHMNDEEKRVMRDCEKQAMRLLGLWRDEQKYDDLFSLACDALKNSYAPYSRFKVGACILTASGKTYQGCNFENASLGATICAERCATACAIADGERRFSAIAIAGESDIAWPCGICRQVLREFGPLDMPVIVGKKGDPYYVKTLEELLPESFGPENLGSHMEHTEKGETPDE